MTITKSEIEHLCGLSKLNLDDDELPIYLQQMTDILEMIEQLQSADTNEIIPMAHPLDMHQRLREDIVTETNHRDIYQKNSSHVEEGFYKVPKVIE